MLGRHIGEGLMIKVSIFAGPLETANLNARRAWLDLAYHEVGPYSDYKTCLFQNGFGCGPTLLLKRYPRWSASIWDLIARVICINLNANGAPESENLEFMPGPIQTGKHIAFAEELSVSVEHQSGGKVTRNRALCSMNIKKGRRKGMYVASLTDNLGQSFSNIEVTYKPSVFQPALLVAKVACQHLHGDAETLPEKPVLMLPTAQVEGGQKWICVNAVREPARSGFQRWLAESKIPLIESEQFGEVAHADNYARFLVESL